MISLIAAIAENYSLGRDGKMPWHLPADLSWFKNCTLGRPVIMGRKTFQSFEKPLAERFHIVISHTPQKDRQNVIWVTSLEQAIETAETRTGDEIMVIGGGEIYSQALPLADRLYLTEIAAVYEGDIFFPAFDKSKWRKNIIGEYAAENDQPAFVIAQYDRI